MSKPPIDLNDLMRQVRAAAGLPAPENEGSAIQPGVGGTTESPKELSRFSRFSHPSAFSNQESDGNNNNIHGLFSAVSHTRIREHANRAEGAATELSFSKRPTQAKAAKTAKVSEAGETACALPVEPPPWLRRDAKGTTPSGSTSAPMVEEPSAVQSFADCAGLADALQALVGLIASRATRAASAVAAAPSFGAHTDGSARNAPSAPSAPAPASFVPPQSIAEPYLGGLSPRRLPAPWRTPWLDYCRQRPPEAVHEAAAFLGLWAGVLADAWTVDDVFGPSGVIHYILGRHVRRCDRWKVLFWGSDPFPRRSLLRTGK